MKQSRFAVRPRARFLPGWLVRTTVPRGVLLTFDDGPHSEYTPQVLDRLNAFGVRGTFFVIGKRIEQAREMPPRPATSGHEIGNHSYNHEPPPLFARTAYQAELERCQQAVLASTGTSPRVFRSPFGRLTPAVVPAARGLGLEIVHWSLDSNDWRCRSDEDADRCAEETVAAAGNGDIILFHDVHEYIARILDKVLPGLRARGLL